MKFDCVIGNPPYNKGMWRKFLIKSLEISDNVIMIAPDGTGKFTKQSDKLETTLYNNGLQSITDCTDQFNVDTGIIVYYNLNKNNPPIKIKVNPIVEKVINKGKCLTATISKNRSKEFNQLKRYATPSPNRIFNIDSIGKTNYINKDSATIINGSDYFITNRYFSKNKVTPLEDYNKEISIGTNILAIKHYGLSKQNFESIYLSKLFRYILKQLRKETHDVSAPHIRMLPLLENRQWTDAELYDHFGLTEEERLTVQGKM